jgi:hypothetical protein
MNYNTIATATDLKPMHIDRIILILKKYGVTAMTPMHNMNGYFINKKSWLPWHHYLLVAGIKLLATLCYHTALFCSHRALTLILEAKTN